MSQTILQETASLARQAAVEAAWRQWSRLGAGALSLEAPARSIIDPEALVLISLALLEEERRLGDVLAWWARAGARWLSVQRMKVLAEEFPVGVRAGLGRFARSAVEAKDGRWRRHAAEAPLEARSRSTKETETPDLTAPPALMLRLRAGFGVNAKSDVLAVLLGLDERRAAIQALATATGYAGVTLREATHDLALARFIRRGAESPLNYYAPQAPWAALLRGEGRANTTGGEDPSAWRFWSQVFAFLAHVDSFAHSKAGREGSVYVQGSLARDHIEVHRQAFTLNRIALPEVEVFREETYLGSFQEAVQRLAAWMAEQV